MSYTVAKSRYKDSLWRKTTAATASRSAVIRERETQKRRRLLAELAVYGPVPQWAREYVQQKARVWPWW